MPQKTIYNKMKRSRESEEEISPARGTDYENSSAESDVAIVPAFKIAELDLQDGDTQPDSAMKCSMPGHKDGLAFNSYEEYAAHYNSAHTNRCLECHKNFPSSLLLDVHIEESHDAFVAARREKGGKTVCYSSHPEIPSSPIWLILLVLMFCGRLRKKMLDSREETPSSYRQTHVSEKLLLCRHKGWHRWQEINVGGEWPPSSAVE